MSSGSSPPPPLVVSRSKEWTCCFGIHVRTATIIIGVWHLCLNILALGVLTVIVRSPSMVRELQGTRNAVEQEVHPALPTPLSKIEPPGSYKDHEDISGLMYICLIAISSMLVYGALKGKRSYLLPFFCLQLFDFAITTLTAANFLTYLRQVHRLLENQKLPWRDELLELSPQTLSIVVLIAFISVVMLKAYAIGIVWRCYKFITLQRQNLATMLPYLISEVNSGAAAGRMERDYSSLLPDYDEAISQSLKQAPPPSYSVAMSVNGHVMLGDASATNATQQQQGPGDATTSPPPYIQPATAAAGSPTTPAH